MTDSTSDFLLGNGRIVDGLGNAPFDGSVLVAGERISRVWSAAEAIDLPESVRRIDVGGMTIMPGLIDSHCHISFDEPSSNDELFFHRREGLAAIIAARNVQRLLRAGVTGFMDPDSLGEIGVDLRDAIEAGIIHGPRMSVGGNALLTSVGGTAGRLLPDEGRRGYGKIVASRDEIVAEVRRQVKNGVDWIKVHVTGLAPRMRCQGELQVWSYDELKLVTDTAHELGTPVTGHCRGASSIRDAARAGLDLILHATYMDEEALEAVIEAGVPIVPTFAFQANLADYGEDVGASPSLQALFKREISDSAVMLKRAFDAGIPLLCGTESGFSITPYGEWHYRELEVFVNDIGLTPLEAIKAATSDNALALRLEGDTGAIAAGRLADIIVVDGDPSKDVTVLGEPGRIRQVYIGGVAQPTGPITPVRSDPPGWRVSHYGDRILNYDFVRSRRK
ncbi:MAG: amidohydrolase family protein [Halieaceae bacterium]|jgi:imidazolonepropionase-like amidohydrolase|nr:amidohydrolase family protein [Halieaceae bacterium]